MSVTVGFIGLGLIGGSIARALKANAAVAAEVLAYDPDGASLTRAFEEGTVDSAVSGIGPEFGICDYVFLCAPVSANIINAEAVGPFLKSGSVLTDVGSVKGEMHRKIHDLGLDGVFIGGHPMAGSERIGFANSKAKLLENAYYIITKTPGTAEGKLERYRDLVRAMGAIPLVMTPEEHDLVAAAVSHVPHVISASLVNLVRECDGSEGVMRMVAAGGFKDITRISSSSPEMWRQICLSNSGNISELLKKYIGSLQEVKDAVDSGDRDALFRFFDSARRYRDTFADASSGPIKSSNAIHVEIPDEPGSLAAAVTVLSSRGIGIRNVGIVHNREVESGSLRIELYGENAVKEACGLLRAEGYDASVGRPEDRRRTWPALEHHTGKRDRLSGTRTSR